VPDEWARPGPFDFARPWPLVTVNAADKAKSETTMERAFIVVILSRSWRRS